MLLDDAITDLIHAGTYQPAEVAARLRERGDEWLCDALIESADHLITQRTRELLHTVEVPATAQVVASRRRKQAPPPTHRDTFGPAVWIEGVGYVPEAEVTVEQWRVRAAYYRMLEGAHREAAERVEGIITRLVDAGVDTLAALEAAAARPHRQPAQRAPRRTRRSAAAAA